MEFGESRPWRPFVFLSRAVMAAAIILLLLISLFSCVFGNNRCQTNSDCVVSGEGGVIGVCGRDGFCEKPEVEEETGNGKQEVKKKKKSRTRPRGVRGVI